VNDPEVIHSQLENAKTIAVIGLSDNPQKPSHYVSAYMQQQGYKILPVNPSLTEVLGERSYPSLTDLPTKPDLVNVFRVPGFLPAIVDEMLELGLRVQQGIVNLGAAARAEEGGIRVVMDRCIMVEHRRVNLS
jgi:predicted CoA-binding protein